MTIVRLGTIAGFVNLVKSLDGNIDKICALCGIEATLFDPKDHDTYISIDTLSKLMNTCAQQMHCPHFGLLLGLKKEILTLGVLGLLLIQCKTFQDVLQTICDKHYLDCQDAVQCELYYDNDLVVLRIDQNLPEHQRNPQLTDLINGSCISIFRHLGVPELKLQEIRLTGRQRPSYEHYCNMTSAPVKFSQPFNELVFHRKTLTIQLKPADPQVTALLQSFLDEQVPLNRSYLQETLAYLKNTLGTATCNCGSAAHYFALSKRSYNRKLTKENTSFSQLLQQVKAERAKTMLQDNANRITNTAYALGYSDVSSFTKAFKLWYGQTPTQWQKNQQKKNTE